MQCGAVKAQAIRSRFIPGLSLDVFSTNQNENFVTLALSKLPATISEPIKPGQNATESTDISHPESIGGTSSQPRFNFAIGMGFLFMTKAPSEKRLMILVDRGHLRITQDGEIWRGDKRAEMKRDNDFLIFGMVDGEFTRTTARRLVWQFYFGNIPQRHRVAVKDGDVFNNAPSNLELFRSPNRVERRFWSKVTILQDSECWLWTGSRNEKGYGTFTMNRFEPPVLASRFAFETRNPPLGKDFALHRCDNPPCVNPAHLFRGNAMDNTMDMMAKGRHHSQKMKAAM